MLGTNMLIHNNERRAFHRMAIEAPVIVTADDIEITGTCKDLSSTGMLVQLPESNITAGMNIKLLLTTDNQRFPPLDVKAKVLRVNAKGDSFLIAAEFTDIK